MEQVTPSRPSPALLVASVALTFALATTAIAAPETVNRAVSKSKVKKIAKKQIKKLAPGLSVANAAALGGKPASAYQEKARWALVDADGNIVAQSGGITASHQAGTGNYFLDYGAPVSGKFVSATGQNVNTVVVAGPCGGPPLGSNCSQGNDANHLRVDVTAGGGFVERPFFVGVFP